MLTQHVLKSAAGIKQDLDWPSNRKFHTVVSKTFTKKTTEKRIAEVTSDKPQEKERLRVYTADAWSSNTIRVEYNDSQMLIAMIFTR